MSKFSDKLSTIWEYTKAVAAGLSGHAGEYVAEKEAERQRKYDEKQRALQRNQALADRAHDEAYNSPQAQKDRLLSANLSPVNFGDVPTTDSSSGASVAYEPNGAITNMLASAREQSVEMPMRAMELMLMKQRNDAEVRNLNSMVSKRTSDKETTDLLNYKTKQTLSNDIEQSNLETLLKGSQLQKSYADVYNAIQDGKLKGKAFESASLSLKLARDTYDSMVSLAKANAANAEYEAEIKKYNLDFTLPATLKEINSRVAKNFNDIEMSKQLNQREWQLLDANLKMIQQQIYNIDYQNFRLEFRNGKIQEEYDNEVKRIEAELKAKGVAAELAQKEANWYGFNQIMGATYKTCDMGLRITGAVVTGGASEGVRQTFAPLNSMSTNVSGSFPSYWND